MLNCIWLKVNCASLHHVLVLPFHRPFCARKFAAINCRNGMCPKPRHTHPGRRQACPCHPDRSHANDASQQEFPCNQLLRPGMCMILFCLHHEMSAKHPHRNKKTPAVSPANKPQPKRGNCCPFLNCTYEVTQWFLYINVALLHKNNELGVKLWGQG